MLVYPELGISLSPIEEEVCNSQEKMILGYTPTGVYYVTDSILDMPNSADAPVHALALPEVSRIVIIDYYSVQVINYAYGATDTSIRWNIKVSRQIVDVWRI